MVIGLLRALTVLIKETRSTQFKIQFNFVIQFILRLASHNLRMFGYFWPLSSSKGVTESILPKFLRGDEAESNCKASHTLSLLISSIKTSISIDQKLIIKCEKDFLKYLP